MVMPDGRRVDVAATNRHEVHYEPAYGLLQQSGIHAVRESLRWHRIEAAPGRLRRDDLVGRLRALRARRMTAIWSLTQFGVPDWLDVWSSEFPDAFGRYAEFVARCFRDECDDVPFWAPVNEISYWAWAAGSIGPRHRYSFYPCALERGNELKRQLVRAAICASEALRRVDPRARLVQIDPLLVVLPDQKIDNLDHSILEASGMFEAWDMLRGTSAPELGGHPDLIDIVGVNFYPDNERFTDGSMVPPRHSAFVPFHRLARRVADRYGRPLLVSETGDEGAAGVEWLRYMAKEMHRLSGTTDVVGMTIYPVMDYCGWTDGRHCECGLIRCDGSWQERELRHGHALAAAAAEGLWTRRAA